MSKPFFLGLSQQSRRLTKEYRYPEMSYGICISLRKVNCAELIIFSSPIGWDETSQEKRRRWLPSAKVYKTREFTAQALPAQRTETRGRRGRKESRDESNATY